jgi:hypothetical protein
MVVVISLLWNVCQTGDLKQDVPREEFVDQAAEAPNVDFVTNRPAEDDLGSAKGCWRGALVGSGWFVEIKCYLRVSSILSQGYECREG